jgi:hypothetical protein
MTPRFPLWVRLVPVLLIAPDRLFHAAAQQTGRARHEREIFFLQLALLELLREPAVREVALRHQNHPRGLAIQPVHDARPFDASDPAQLAFAVREERMNKGVIPRARTGMHDHARGLVDREHVLVLEYHFQRNLHRAHPRGNQIGKSKTDLHTTRDFLVPRNRLSRHPHQTRVKRAVKRHAAVLGERPGKNFVGAVAAAGGRNGVDLFGHGFLRADHPVITIANRSISASHFCRSAPGTSATAQPLRAN